jgi:hypothetical protein
LEKKESAMKKTIIILAASLLSATPVLAETFTRDGTTYVYSTEQRGAVTWITGADVTNRRDFILRVSRGRVEGTVDGNTVSFRSRDAQRLQSNVTVTEVAAR